VVQRRADHIRALRAAQRPARALRVAAATAGAVAASARDPLEDATVVVLAVD
jgi:hypothetical protein